MKKTILSMAAIAILFGTASAFFGQTTIGTRENNYIVIPNQNNISQKDTLKKDKTNMHHSDTTQVKQKYKQKNNSYKSKNQTDTI